MIQRRAPPGEHVVVLLEGGAPNPAALAVASAISPVPRPRLHGVLIEDQNVLRLGALVEAREVTLGDARLRVPDAASLERQLFAHAREARRLFEAAAAEFATTVTFEVRRGQLIGELIEGAAGALGLVIDRSRAAALRAWRDPEIARLLAVDVASLAFVASELTEPDGVVAVAEDGPMTEVQQLAERIANRYHLSVLRSSIGLLESGAVPDTGQPRRRINYIVLPARATSPATLRTLLLRWRCTIVLAR
jgi:hypothetical protein